MIPWRMLKRPNIICGTVLKLRALSASAEQSRQDLPRRLYMHEEPSSERGLAFRETLCSMFNVNDDVKLHFCSISVFEAVSWISRMDGRDLVTEYSIMAEDDYFCS